MSPHIVIQFLHGRAWILLKAPKWSFGVFKIWNGIFGSGSQRHLSFWQAVKVIDKTEEEDEAGVITVREKERFSNELTLVFATGQVATLK